MLHKQVCIEVMATEVCLDRLQGSVHRRPSGNGHAVLHASVRDRNMCQQWLQAAMCQWSRCVDWTAWIPSFTDLAQSADVNTHWHCTVMVCACDRTKVIPTCPRYISLYCNHRNGSLSFAANFEVLYISSKPRSWNAAGYPLRASFQA